MRAARRARVLVLAAALLALPFGASGAQESREQVEQRLAALGESIAALQRELEASRASLGAETRALRAADLELQQSARRLRELDAQEERHRQRLEELAVEREAQLERLDAEGAVLEAQLLAAWRLGRESRLKLLLNQDDPALLTRLMAYYDRFSNAQADAIGQLREMLAGLDALRGRTDAELAALALTRSGQQAANEQLEARRAGRETLVAALQAKIGSDAARLDELQRDRADLERLLERLSDVLADIPPELGERPTPAELRGKLPMPVEGRVVRAFGQARATGLAWQGWLVGAPRGAEVRSVAYGRVAYADWLRGYGLLIIIDHGDGLMSLYGNNESLLYEVGQWVQPGAAIATVGAWPETGPGLYFELRHAGRAVDPAAWIRR